MIDLLCMGSLYFCYSDLDEQNQIVKIQRMAHCHMCGGQGSDDELKRFPHGTLRL